jgi:hypothetical protein
MKGFRVPAGGISVYDLIRQGWQDRSSKGTSLLLAEESMDVQNGDGSASKYQRKDVTLETSRDLHHCGDAELPVTVAPWICGCAD